MRLIKHLKIKEQPLSRFSVFLCFQIITHVSFQLTMFDGKHFVPHMGIFAYEIWIPESQSHSWRAYVDGS